MTRDINPLTAALEIGTSIIGWVFEDFKAKEVQGMKEDLCHVKDDVYKLTDNQKILFATMVFHQEILVSLCQESSEMVRPVHRGPSHCPHEGPADLLHGPRRSLNLFQHGGYGTTG